MKKLYITGAGASKDLNSNNLLIPFLLKNAPFMLHLFAAKI